MATLRTFEDLEQGETANAGPIHVTREAILAFARMYDPQPFHLDEVAASKSLLEGLAASGWQTAAFTMRLYHDGFLRHVASMGAPGIDEVRFTRPVRPGDDLTLFLKLGAKRESRSKPDRGLVNVTLDLRNAAGATVLKQAGPLMVGRRNVAPILSPVVYPSEAPVQIVEAAPVDLHDAAFYDDIEIGRESTFGTQLFTADLIADFARIYDPQPFHIDAEAARASHFGGIIASGWQTGAFWMKHYIAARTRSAEARRLANLPVAVGGPSPGLSNIRWLHPVRAGMAVTYGMKILDKRKASRPGWGLIHTLNTGHAAADGTLVYAAEANILWPLAPLDEG